MFTPRETVEALDKYIVGQDEAKRAVAIALRNRYRRSRLSPEMREEITPKNIIMVGPTGVGKTEIARRLAKLVDAPLVKVEATKFTEVGYVGRDVDSIVRDLVEASIRLCKQKRYEAVETVAKAAAEQRLIELLMPTAGKKVQKPFNPIQLLLGSGSAPEADADKELSEEEKTEHLNKRQQIAQQLSNGLLENELVEIEVEQQNTGSDAMLAMGIDINLNEMMGGLIPKNKKKRRVKVSEARRILTQEESEKLIDMEPAEGGFTVNIHKGGEEGCAYAACGSIRDGVFHARDYVIKPMNSEKLFVREGEALHLVDYNCSQGYFDLA